MGDATPHKNILTYLLTYLRNNNKINPNYNRIQEGHTTQIIYKKEDWLKFKHILDFENTNPNRMFWALVEMVLEQYDMKEHSLDKFVEEFELMTPNIDTSPEIILKFLKSKSIETIKQYETKFQQVYIYTKAITQGEIELDNYPFLWRKYH